MASMEDMNNFHSYFPGGHRRQRFLDGKSSERERKIIGDLDGLIEGSGIDIKHLQEERSLWTDGVAKVHELARKGATLSDVEPIGLESERHCKNVQGMIYPFFLKMFEKGYTRNELTA